MPDGEGPVVADGDPQMIESCDAHDSNEVVNVPLQSVVPGNDSLDCQVFQGSPEKSDVCNSGPDVEGTIDGTELPEIKVWQNVETSESPYFFYESTYLVSKQRANSE